MLLVALLVAVVLGGVVGLVVVKANSGSNATLTLEPADASGSDPFTDSITNSTKDPSAAAQAQFASTRSSFAKDGKTGALLAAATAPGLYGGTGDTKVCNSQKLITYLNANPDKANAWADVFDITAADIPAYVASLTPVVLTSDTRVTNHGYKSGRATSYQAVLEAGTAVLVDTNGIPRVKCNCGNPLGEPTTLSLTNATLNGIQWATYTPTQVVTIQQSIQITTFVIINTQTATTYNQPAPPPPQLQTGTTDTTARTEEQAEAGVWVAVEVPQTTGGDPSASVILTSSDGATWTQIAKLDGIYFGALAYGNGVWLAADYDPIDDSPSAIYTSTDLVYWTRTSASIDGVVTDLAYGDGVWVATTEPKTEGDPVAYNSTDGLEWSPASVEAPNGPGFMLTAAAFGDGIWTAVGSTGASVAPLRLTTYQSDDGVTWSPSGPVLDDAVWQRDLAYRDRTWIVTAALDDTSAIRVSLDGSSWSAPTPTPDPGHDLYAAVASGGSGFLLAVNDDSGARFNRTTRFYVSIDGKTWRETGQLQDTLTALAFGSP